MYKLNLPESWTNLSASFLIAGTNVGVNPSKSPKEIFELFSIPGYDSGSSEITTGKSIGSNKQIVKDGQILLSKINPRISRVWIVKKTTNFRSIASTEWIAFNSFDFIDEKFLKYFLLSEPVRVYLASKVTGSGGSLQRVNKETVSKMSIPLPPKSEQKRIVAKIESTQEKIKTVEESVSKAEELIGKYRESLLQKAFRGQLVPQDPNDEPASELLKRIRADRAQVTDGKKKEEEEDLPPISEQDIPFEIPKSWTWVRLSEVVDSFQNGISKRSGERGRNVPVLRLADISGSVFSTDNLRAITLTNEEEVKYALKKKDLIVIRVNGSRHLVGKFISTENVENVAFSDHLIRIRPNLRLISSYYLKLLGEAPHIRSQIDRTMVSSAGQNTISQASISNLMIPLPPIMEQDSIVKKIYQYSESCANTTTLISTLKYHVMPIKNSILNKAFSGNLVDQIESEGTGIELFSKIKQTAQTDDEMKPQKTSSTKKITKTVKK